MQLVKVAVVKRRYKKRSARDPELIAARRKLAGELRDTLIRLGPTFIKVRRRLSRTLARTPPPDAAAHQTQKC